MKIQNSYKKVVILIANKFVSYISRISKKCPKTINLLNYENIGAFGSSFDTK